MLSSCTSYKVHTHSLCLHTTACVCVQTCVVVFEDKRVHTENQNEAALKANRKTQNLVKERAERKERQKRAPKQRQQQFFRCVPPFCLLALDVAVAAAAAALLSLYLPTYVCIVYAYIHTYIYFFVF